MSTSDTGQFPQRQAIADLAYQVRTFPLASVRRIAAGLALRRSDAPDVARRIEWYFRGRAPLARLRDDGLVFGVVMMASALPDDDFEPFLAATSLLLLERLSVPGGRDDAFWNWRRLAPHYRLAPPPLRAAIMCGFREARRIGRVSLPGGPEAPDCLTRPRGAVLTELEAFGTLPPLDRVRAAILGDIDPLGAGALWADLHGRVARLPDEARRAAHLGFRHLYERPASMHLPAGADAPVIPVHD